MNWANKLFEKSWYSIEDGGRKDHFYVNDLVLAVLEKNKEIELSGEFADFKSWTKGDKIRKDEQARAWRELTVKCKEVQR